MSISNNNNTSISRKNINNTINNSNTNQNDQKKRQRDNSFFSDLSVLANNSKKLCDNPGPNFSISVTEFEFFQLNLHKMNRLDQLNSTEADEVIENDPIINTEDTEDPDVQQLLSNPNPSLHDVVKSLANLTIITKQTRSNVTSINSKLSTITKKVEINSKNINTLNTNAQIQYNIVMKNLENVNFMKQEKIDNEIFVSGFEQIPDEKLVIKEFCKFYSLPHNTIKEYRVIPSKNSDGSIKSAFMNIQFCLKADHIKCLKAVRETGPLPLNNVTPSLSSSSSTTTHNPKSKKLKISRRLTIENKKVISRLQPLLDEKKISKIRYRNCFYEMMPLQQSKFIPVPSVEHLDYIQSLSQTT